MTWLPLDHAGRHSSATEHEDEYDAVMALQPRAGERWRDVVERSWSITDSAVLDLCRIRMAQVLRCSFALRDVAAGVLAELDHSWTSPRFSDFERSAVSFAEQFAIDQTGISDAQIDALARHLGRAELCDFVAAVNAHDGDLRMLTILDIAPASVERTTIEPSPSSAAPAGTVRAGSQEAIDPGLDGLELWTALVDPTFSAARGSFEATTALLDRVDVVTTEVCRLRNAEHQACAY